MSRLCVVSASVESLTKNYPTHWTPPSIILILFTTMTVYFRIVTFCRSSFFVTVSLFIMMSHVTLSYCWLFEGKVKVKVNVYLYSASS